MSIYHLSVKVIGRSSGRSAVAAAAYRSGSKLYEEETGKTYNYKRKGGVAYSEIDLPAQAPAEFTNRQILWNSVQAVEKNKNAQLAREIEFAIPREIENRQMQIAIAHEYINATFVKAGMCADWSLHDKQDGNVHVHCMLTMRPIGPDGKWEKKESRRYKLDAQGKRIPVIDPRTGKQKIGAKGRKMWERAKAKDSGWNKKENIEIWRKAWADICNKHLDKDHQIDHRSYARQGVDKIPTIHMGYAAIKRANLGLQTERMNINADAQKYNAINLAITQSIKATNNNLRTLKKEIRNETIKDYEKIILSIIHTAEVEKDTSIQDIDKRFLAAGIDVLNYDDGTTRFEYRDITHAIKVGMKTDKYYDMLNQIINRNIKDIQDIKQAQEEDKADKAAIAKADNASYLSLMRDMAHNDAIIEREYQVNADTQADIVDNDIEKTSAVEAEEQQYLMDYELNINALNISLTAAVAARKKKEAEIKAKKEKKKKEIEAQVKGKTIIKTPPQETRIIVTHTQYWGVRQMGHYQDIQIVTKSPKGKIISKIYSDRQYNQILKNYPDVAKKYGINKALVDKIRARDNNKDKGRSR